MFLANHAEYSVVAKLTNLIMSKTKSNFNAYEASPMVETLQCPWQLILKNIMFYLVFLAMTELK